MTIDPSDLTIDELEDELADVDSRGELQSILEAERDGEDRKGAREAIERRLDEHSDEDDADAEADTDTVAGDADGDVDVVTIRDRAGAVAEDLVGKSLDSVTGVERDGEEWHALVDVVERSAVPDTQDILGRYEIRFDEQASVVGYRRRTRFRRSDTTDEL